MIAEVRRTPRAAPAGAGVTLQSRLAVRIVNISLTGVLLEASEGTASIECGDYLDLTVPLDGAGFTARLRIGREHRLADARAGFRVRIGCAFVDLDSARRKQLADFLTDGFKPSRTPTAE